MPAISPRELNTNPPLTMAHGEETILEVSEVRLEFLSFGQAMDVHCKAETQLEDFTVLFMLESQARPGVSREQLVRHFTGKLSPTAWDLIRHGTVTNVMFKTGTDVGFFALLSAPSMEDAKAMIAQGVETDDLFDMRLVPVNQFPHYD